MRKNGYIFIGLFLLMLILALLDVCCGSVWISPLSTFNSQLSTLNSQLLLHLRLPKMLTAILAGASLSVAGLMMQTLFRNPLAGPYILGVSSGASLGVALVTMCGTFLTFNFQLSTFNSQLIASAAILGSILTMLLVMAFARRIRSNVTLLIVGMMVGNIAGALVNMIQNFANPDSLKLFIVWTLGSLSGVSWDELPTLAICILIATIVVLMLIKPLNGLLLGEDYARGLGIHIERTRWMMVLASCLLAGSVTAFCGLP